jgi:hypothetical protein
VHLDLVTFLIESHVFALPDWTVITIFKIMIRKILLTLEMFLRVWYYFYQHTLTVQEFSL